MNHRIQFLFQNPNIYHKFHERDPALVASDLPKTEPETFKKEEKEEPEIIKEIPYYETEKDKLIQTLTQQLSYYQKKYPLEHWEEIDQQQHSEEVFKCLWKGYEEELLDLRYKLKQMISLQEKEQKENISLQSNLSQTTKDWKNCIKENQLLKSDNQKLLNQISNLEKQIEELDHQEIWKRELTQQSEQFKLFLQKWNDPYLFKDYHESLKMLGLLETPSTARKLILSQALEKRIERMEQLQLEKNQLKDENKNLGLQMERLQYKYEQDLKTQSESLKTWNQHVQKLRDNLDQVKKRESELILEIQKHKQTQSQMSQEYDKLSQNFTHKETTLEQYKTQFENLQTDYDIERKKLIHQLKVKEREEQNFRQEQAEILKQLEEKWNEERKEMMREVYQLRKQKVDLQVEIGWLMRNKHQQDFDLEHLNKERERERKVLMALQLNQMAK